MIVAFADRTSMIGRRRRPSDASQGTRTSTSSDNQMIVSFKRRQSDDSISNPKPGQHGKSRRNKGTSSTRKKQTHPSRSSTIVDPIATQRRRSAEEQENKVRKRNQGKRNSLPCISDVIVEFPEHRRSSTRKQHHTQDGTLDSSLRNMFKRNNGSTRNMQSSSSCCSGGKPISKNYQQSSRLNKSDRQFKEHDWGKTSIVWGDSTDEEESSTDYHEDFCPEKIGKTGRLDPDGFKPYRNGQRGGGIDRSESTRDTWESTRTMTSSLSSLLSGSFIKLDP